MATLAALDHTTHRAPPLNREPGRCYVREGDMDPYYEDDLVTLYHGDCREVTEWLEADVLVTDPPYGRRWRQGDIEDLRGPKSRNESSLTGITNDDSTAVRDAALHLWGDRPGIVFGDLMLAPPASTKLVCIYHKTDPTTGLRGTIAGVRRDAEAIYLVGNWGSKQYRRPLVGIRIATADLVGPRGRRAQRRTSTHQGWRRHGRTSSPDDGCHC